MNRSRIVGTFDADFVATDGIYERFHSRKRKLVRDIRGSEPPPRQAYASSIRGERRFYGSWYHRQHDNQSRRFINTDKVISFKLQAAPQPPQLADDDGENHFIQFVTTVNMKSDAPPFPVPAKDNVDILVVLRNVRNQRAAQSRGGARRFEPQQTFPTIRRQ